MNSLDITRPRPRVLVADDEVAVARRLGEVIKAEGFELAGVADTAARTVELARSLKPDLVLMDILRPGNGSGASGGSEQPGGLDDSGDGLDACALIQRTLNIPVVLLTARLEDGFLRRARRALPSAYLLKPCQNGQLRAAIEMALAQREHCDPAAPFLLRESHHRIKNSFSLLHSMLRFQEVQTVDTCARHALAAAGARVLALAKAHETMQDCAPEAQSDARGHVQRLARTLFEALAPPPPQAVLGLELDLEPLGLLPEQVVPCSIFLAEALTNAIKHAFPDGREGVIRVRLGADGPQAELAISDNGAGLGGDPAELGSNSFGLQCLQAAAEQLEGVLDIRSEPGEGARFRVRFPRGRSYQSLSA